MESEKTQVDIHPEILSLIDKIIDGKYETEYLELSRPNSIALRKATVEQLEKALNEYRGSIKNKIQQFIHRLKYIDDKK